MAERDSMVSLGAVRLDFIEIPSRKEISKQSEAQPLIPDWRYDEEGEKSICERVA